MQTSERGRVLSELPPGSVAEVKAVHAGCGLRGRLTAMGLHRGVSVRVIQNAGRGPLIVEVAGNRMVLGRGMAEKVHVRLGSEGGGEPCFPPSEGPAPHAAVSDPPDASAGGAVS